MESEELVWLVRVAGALHFVQVPGMLLTLRRLQLSDRLAVLPALMRQMVLVMSGGIVLCVLGVGACVLLNAREVVASRLGWSLCCFGMVFWAYRSAIQLAVYSRSFPRNAGVLHHALAVLFPVKTLVYALCVFQLGRGTRISSGDQSEIRAPQLRTIAHSKGP
jgi:hypothetical protein